MDRFEELHPSLSAKEARSAEGDPDSPIDPELRSYRSGFWATVPIEPRHRPGELQIGVSARLADGKDASASLGTIEVVERPEPLPYDAAPETGEPLIAICMATYNPNMELFRAQVESIREQTYGNWVCVISDDCSEQELFDRIAEVVEGDDRFLLSRAELAPELLPQLRAGARAGPGAGRVPRPLRSGRSLVPGQAHCAQRGHRGRRARLQRPEAHRSQRERARRDDVAGAAQQPHKSRVAAHLQHHRRRLVPDPQARRRAVAPVPERAGVGLSRSLARSRRAVDGRARLRGPAAVRPGPASGRRARARRRRRRAGAGQAGTPPRLDRTPARLPRPAGARPTSACTCSASSMRACCSIAVVQSSPGAKRRALRRVIAAARSPLAFAWLACRPIRSLFGRNETLGIESVLVRGILWRYLIVLRTLGRRRPGASEEDASVTSPMPQKLVPRQRRWLARR